MEGSKGKRREKESPRKDQKEVGANFVGGRARSLSSWGAKRCLATGGEGSREDGAKGRRAWPRRSETQ